LETIDQRKVTDPEAPVPSETLTVTVLRRTFVGVPEIRPVDELIDKPAGRPLAA
jgi:hypothetical protein